MNLDQITLAADSARMQAGGKSLFEKVSDAMTAGVAGATISGLGSIYNTGVWATNNVFGTTAEEIDTAKVLGKIDSNWQQYYEDNKGVIDTVGFIGGAFAPGGLALKVFNSARAGRGHGVVRSALGYTLHKQEDFLEAGLKQIASKGGDVFGALNKNKLLSMSYGAVDNVLQAAVFETAAAVFMQRSPTLTDESWTDISWDIMRNSLFGGVIGGGVEALWTNKIFRAAGKTVEAQARKYDTVVALEGVSAGLGDKAFSIMDDVLDLHPDVLSADKVIPFAYRVNGKDRSVDLDTSKLLDAKRKENIERGYLTFQKNLTEAVAGDPSVGAPFGAALVDIAKQGKSLGKTDGEIREELATVLGNLEGIGSLGGGKIDFTKDTFFVLEGAHLVGKKGETPRDIFSSVRPSSAATGYRLLVPEKDLQVGIIGTPGVGASVKEAYENGFDIVYSGKRGRVHVNPNSTRLTKAEKTTDEELRTTFNVRTKQTSDVAVATVADIVPKGAPTVIGNTVQAGERSWQFTVTPGTPRTLPETRGSGKLFHGSSTELRMLSDEYAMAGDTRNIYGQGFYTTDAVDIAVGYSKKGKGKSPTIHQLQQKTDVKLFDMEQPITADIRKIITKAIGDADYTGSDSLVTKATSLRNWFDEFRAESANFGLSRGEVQDIFDSIRANLEELGYGGYKHLGGKITGKKEHTVQIFWQPEKQLNLQKYTIPDNSTPGFLPTLDSVENTARHLWAATLENFKETTISARDFSVLDRLVANPSLVTDTTRIKLADGSVIPIPEGGLRSFVLGQKLDAAQEILREAGPEIDHRLISYALNTEQKWVQDAIGAEFRGPLLDTPDAFRDLASYAVRDNVVLRYKNVPIADSLEGEFPTALTAYEHRKHLALQQAESAATAVLGNAARRFLDSKPGTWENAFDATGAGPTAFGATNAGYQDRGRLWAQDVGRAVYLTKQERRNEVLNELQPHLVRIINKGDPELGAVLTRARLSEDKLTLYDGKIVDLDSLKQFRELAKQVAEGAVPEEELARFVFKYSYKPNEDTYRFLDAYHASHKKWLADRTVLSAASGRVNHFDEEALYLPPVDTRKVPYFAFVRAKEGRVFASSEVAMITAKDPTELQRLVGKVREDFPDLQVVLKDDVELYKKALGEYEYAKSLNAPVIDPMLRKKGYLGNFVPTLEPKAVAEEFVNFIAKREDDVVRSAVQLKYSQTFAELRWLSDQYTRAQTSKFGYQGKLQTKKVVDQFGDYERLALDVSKQAEYTLWNQANEFVDALGTRAHNIAEDATKRATAGTISWEAANKQLRDVGLGGVFTSQEDFFAAQKGADRSLAKTIVAKGNMLLANLVLRLDAANALINVVSAPIMLGMEVSAIRESLKKDKALAAAFNQSFEIAVPSGGKMPSTTKLISNAIHNFFGPEKRALIDRYENTIGSIRPEISQFHDMMEGLALTPDLVPKKYSEKLDKAFEFGAKWTGNNKAEQMVRFVASDVMRQITQPVVAAGKMDFKEQNAFISIFVNRVHGNYIASQRPIAFQGVLGSAIGLFQTYQFNLMQQVFRHIEDKNTKTLAIAAGLQSTIFGMNGLPMFDAINTHLIGNANINEGHRDIYSTVAAADKEWGEFAMYGMSGFPLFGDKFPALYTRGDLNPRHVTILPTSFSSIPVVEAFTRVGSAVIGIGNQVANGGNFGTALMHGLEHNGINRPLAGLAQVLQGERVTNSGSLIAAHEDLISVATATRLLGARPMDETVAANYRYRLTAYKAADRKRIERLGTVVKEKIRSGDLTEEDVLEFASRYAAVGGRMENYGAAMQRWLKDANQSVLNTTMKAHGTVYAQRMFEIMGGDPLPDVLNPGE